MTAAALALAGGSPSAATSSAAQLAPATAASTVDKVSGETPARAVVTKVDIVTLVTGDCVRVTSYSDGRSSAVVLAGSPHAGQPVQTVLVGGTTYVMPRLLPRERRLLDVSMFNVTALAAQTGDTVPVTITFAKGVSPHDVDGLTVDTASARTSPDGSVTVGAAYATTAPGAAVVAGRAWRGVTSVTLPSGVTTPPPTSEPVHTLTIRLVDVNGDPVSHENAFVQNVDDAAVFFDEVMITDGVGTVSVPEGNYAVIASTVARTVFEPDVAVDGDTSVALDLADATVHPSAQVPGYGVADATVALQREATTGGGFIQLLQADRFMFFVQPVKGEVQHGKLWTSVAAAHAPADELPPTGDVFSTLAYTKDYRSGLPRKLRFTHPRSDFAIVPQKFYANGPASRRTADALAFAPYEFFSMTTEFPVRVPSLRTVWLQGTGDLVWEQDYQPTGTFSDRPASLGTIGHYTAGKARTVSFAHGPVGPGVEARYDRNRIGAYCLLCRDGAVLHGSMPLFSGAGTAMFGLLESRAMGSWSLKQGDDVVDTGSYVLAPDVRLPAERHPFTLTASSHPGVRSWQLSTEVTDVWTFTSAAGEDVVPLLMASYVPKIALDGSLAAGPTGFRLDFGNLGPVDAKVESASVELSTDGGRHWTAASMTRIDRNSFAVSYQSPRPSGSKDTMSLRVTGVDTAGRGITETALDVYTLTR